MTQTPPQAEGQHRAGVATQNLRSFEGLRRSATDRKIAGVAGGLGRHLNIDPTVLRVLLVVLAFFGGAGLVLYAAAWLVVPEEGNERSIVQTRPGTRNAVLIVVGVLAALLLVGDSWGGIGFPWPLALVALVLLVVLLNRDSDRTLPTPVAPTSHPDAAAGGPDPEAATLMSDTAAYATPTPVPPGTPSPPAPPGMPGAGWGPPGGIAPPPPPVDRGPKLFGPTVALLAIALGALGLYDTAADVPQAGYAALALTVVGVMLLVGSVVGRPGGLILLGVVAAIALAITSAVDGDWTTESRIARTPATAADVRDSYHLSAGQIRLDLTEVADPTALDGRTVTLDAAAGELLVIVPPGLDVDVDATIDVGGEVEVDGFVENGNAVDVSRAIDGGPDAPQLSLQLDVTVGHIEVRQEDAA